MILETEEFGRVEVRTLSLPDHLGSDVLGTYTASGRVLVSARQPEKGKDWYRVFTIEDDGTNICEVFNGEIPQKQGANGIRWLCYSDNRRILLGDYVLECEPDLDHCSNSSLVDVVFPKEIAQLPGVFMRWSEPIIAPDNVHVCFTTLTSRSAYNFFGRLERKEHSYIMEDACIISTISDITPDPDHPGCYIQMVQRSGEVKQFVRGGRGITLVGGGRSISESCLQMLDSEEFSCITDTLGYEETAIFSPNEVYAISMSPRFSPRTDAGILGVIPRTGDVSTRSRYLNVLYQYAIAGVRSHRAGNIGPALIHIEKSMKEGRNYTGANLSDPDGEWVYYSPMSWHPDSTRALWNERTRLCAGPVGCRLRICHLLDVKPSAPVSVQRTPDSEEIPYAKPVSAAFQSQAITYPLIIKGKTGEVQNLPLDSGAWETRYVHYSEDGETFYDGIIRVKAPEDMFRPGKTTIESNLEVSGAHTGQMKLCLVLQADARFQIHPDLGKDENGRPNSYGFAEYDGMRREVEDLEP